MRRGHIIPNQLKRLDVIPRSRIGLEPQRFDKKPDVLWQYPSHVTLIATFGSANVNMVEPMRWLPLDQLTEFFRLLGDLGNRTTNQRNDSGGTQPIASPVRRQSDFCKARSGANGTYAGQRAHSVPIRFVGIVNIQRNGSEEVAAGSVQFK